MVIIIYLKIYWKWRSILEKIVPSDTCKVSASVPKVPFSFKTAPRSHENLFLQNVIFLTKIKFEMHYIKSELPFKESESLKNIKRRKTVHSSFFLFLGFCSCKWEKLLLCQISLFYSFLCVQLVLTLEKKGCRVEQ